MNLREIAAQARQDVPTWSGRGPSVRQPGVRQPAVYQSVPTRQPVKGVPASAWYMARSVVGTGLLFGLVGAVLPGVTAKGSAKVGAAVGAVSSVWALWSGKAKG